MRFLSLALAAVCVAAVAAVPFPSGQAANGGQHWALLIAGSNTWGNYRHQADIYHAYQIMKRNGLKDENIVVMHYDDIAANSENPKKGTVINKPDGSDVYAGVPKDYTGSDVNANNFLAVLAGDKSKVNGGSGKVIASGPNDMVFVYYADHGGTGILGMPEGESYLYGKDIVSTLQTKAANKGFKQLVFYLEACESGSIFEGSLPENINVYATTAANAEESSWGTYCPGMSPSPPSGYNTCRGDLYSVAWMENADQFDLRSESLLKQYQLVAQRTSQNGTFSQGSHVMQYGEVSIDSESCAAFMGTSSSTDFMMSPATQPERMGAVEQRDASLMYYHQKYLAAEGDAKKAALEEYAEHMQMRLNIDESVEAVATAVGHELSQLMAAKVLVNDWDCYKQAIQGFQNSCGPLGQYGMKYGRALAGLCNAGVSARAISLAASSSCRQ
jgi:legumain